MGDVVLLVDLIVVCDPQSLLVSGISSEWWWWCVVVLFVDRTIASEGRSIARSQPTRGDTDTELRL